jgi:hypothetical protein
MAPTGTTLPTIGKTGGRTSTTIARTWPRSWGTEAGRAANNRLRASKRPQIGRPAVSKPRANVKPTVSREPQRPQPNDRPIASQEPHRPQPTVKPAASRVEPVPVRRTGRLVLHLAVPAFLQFLRVIPRAGMGRVAMVRAAHKRLANPARAPGPGPGTSGEARVEPAVPGGEAAWVAAVEAGGAAVSSASTAHLAVTEWENTSCTISSSAVFNRSGLPLAGS